MAAPLGRSESTQGMQRTFEAAPAKATNKALPNNEVSLGPTDRRLSQIASTLFQERHSGDAAPTASAIRQTEGQTQAPKPNMGRVARNLQARIKGYPEGFPNNTIDRENASAKDAKLIRQIAKSDLSKDEKISLYNSVLTQKNKMSGNIADTGSEYFNKEMAGALKELRDSARTTSQVSVAKETPTLKKTTNVASTNIEGPPKTKPKELTKQRVSKQSDMGLGKTIWKLFTGSDEEKIAASNRVLRTLVGTGGGG